MANENNINNELADEDPTSELETPTWQKDDIVVERASLEVEANTIDFAEMPAARRNEASDPSVRKVRFELEQQSALLRGLKAESGAREEIIEELQRQVTALQDNLERKSDALSRSRSDHKAVKQEIRERNELFQEQMAKNVELEANLDRLQSENASLAERLKQSDEALDGRDSRLDELQEKLRVQHDADSSGEIAEPAWFQHTITNLEDKLDRANRGADDMRQQLQDHISKEQQRTTDFEQIARNLREERSQNQTLTETLAETRAETNELRDDLSLVAGKHADELKRLHSELEESKEAIAQQLLINEQLASDLVDTRSFKHDLEQILTANEESSQQKIQSLERQLQKLDNRREDLERQVESKNETINALLAELAAKRAQSDSVQDTGEMLVEELDDTPAVNIPVADSEKVRRCLTGEIDGQEVRFPLFKERMTIGRTQSNDIQLSADYISRRHAVIVTDGDATRIIDWGSRNGVQVNAQPVTEHFLTHGDQVTIGTYDFMYEVMRRAE